MPTRSTSPLSGESLRLLSANTIQPFQRPASLEQVAPSLLLHRITRRFRRMASLRAIIIAPSRSLAWVASRLEFTSDVNEGTAVPMRIAATASVTMSSTRVNP